MKVVNILEGTLGVCVSLETRFPLTDALFGEMYWEHFAVVP